jgi:uncharacterized repeat protein (TIGR01451 family)
MTLRGLRSQMLTVIWLVSLTLWLAPVRAASVNPHTCMGAANCTANDTSIARAFAKQAPPECEVNTTISFELFADIATTATERYDLGVWVNVDGTSAQTGHICSVSDIDIPPGHADDGDKCGDIRSSDGTVTVDLGPVSVPCIDTDNDGFLDVDTCLSWDQNANTTCNGPGDIQPGTLSKCKCGRIKVTNIHVDKCHGVVCTASDQCHDAGTCDPNTGLCSNPTKTDGSACDDGNACTQTDTCQAGTCTGSNPVTCTASDQCHVPGICDPQTGLCSNPAKTDGSACNDGNACTQTDTCQSGTCTGSNPVTCTASDQCHDAGTCDPGSGQCSNPAKADGSGCNDGNACTLSDVCQAGVCTGLQPVICAASDQCHNAGTCDPVSGQCSNPAKPNGTTCNDGKVCTTGDTCQGGTCSGSGTLACDDGDPCTTDTCAEPGGCAHEQICPTSSLGKKVCHIDPATQEATGCTDTSSGSLAANPGETLEYQLTYTNGGPVASTDTTISDPVPNNTTFLSCSDNCTEPVPPTPGQSIVWNVGSVPASQSVTVTFRVRLDGTFSVGSHDITNTGTVTTAPQHGSTSSNEVTVNVIVNCSADCVSTSCTTATCDQDSGACVRTNLAAGTSCDSDSDRCNGVPTCDGNGTCRTDSPVVCPAPDECHTQGTCDPATGTCSNPVKADDSPCSSDGNDCTLDVCRNGVCSHPNAADGSACADDGLFCDGTESCSNGACVHSGDPCAGGADCSNVCNEAAKTCVVADGTPCTDDGVFCDGTESCSNGACVHSGDPCAGGADCSNVCNEAAKTCVVADGTPCTDDGVFCDGTESCSNGACVHSGDPCAGGPECDNLCNELAKNCQVADGTSCTDDGDVCTSDVCQGGACSHDAITPIQTTTESARAYGLMLTALGAKAIPETPDTGVVVNDTKHIEPGTIPADPLAHVELLPVDASSGSDATGSHASATATTAKVQLVDMGQKDADGNEIFVVEATLVKAQVTCAADSGTAGCSAAGSQLTDVKIAGQSYGTVTHRLDPVTVTVPGLGVVKVTLLEELRSGANAGIDLPDNGTNHADLTVNAIHVTVKLDPMLMAPDPIAEIVVSHAEGSVASGPACVESAHVSGRGLVAGVTLCQQNGKPCDQRVDDPSNQIVNSEIGTIDLPSTGGSKDTTLAHVGPVPDKQNSKTFTLLEADAATSHTDGTVNDDGAHSHTQTRVAQASLIDTKSAPSNPLIFAKAVETTCDSDTATASSAGATTLIGLTIGGQDVCESLGLSPSSPCPNDAVCCQPPPNTDACAALGISQLCDGLGLTITLNEQKGNTAGNPTDITVNGIHVTAHDPLPLNGDVKVSSSHCDAATPSR